MNGRKFAHTYIFCRNSHILFFSNRGVSVVTGIIVAYSKNDVKWREKEVDLIRIVFLVF